MYSHRLAEDDVSRWAPSCSRCGRVVFYPLRFEQKGDVVLVCTSCFNELSKRKR